MAGLNGDMRLFYAASGIYIYVGIRQWQGCQPVGGKMRAPITALRSYLMSIG
jgi:hypothetical protein